MAVVVGVRLVIRLRSNFTSLRERYMERERDSDTAWKLLLIFHGCNKRSISYNFVVFVLFVFANNGVMQERSEVCILQVILYISMRDCKAFSLFVGMNW